MGLPANVGDVFVYLAEALAEGRVELIFDGVLIAAGQLEGQRGPFIALLSVKFEQKIFLLFSPLIFTIGLLGH